MLSWLEPFFCDNTYEDGSKKSVGRYLSADKKTEIGYVVYTPATPPKAILQIVHGMNGTVAGYESFARYLSGHGIVVCGEDHIGHGLSTDEERKWHFGPGGAAATLTADIASLTALMRQKYRRLPYVLLGHSLGSFLVRELLTQQDYTDKIDGAILMGSSAELPKKGEKLLFSAIRRLRGDRYNSPLLNRLFYDRLRKPFAEDGPNAWLSSDKVYTDHITELNSEIFFSAKGFSDIFAILSHINGEDWPEELPKSMPLLLTSGEDDTVGELGAGVKVLYERLDDAEICNLTLKLYPKMRHELLHETEKERVYADLLAWIGHVIEGKIAAMQAQAFPTV